VLSSKSEGLPISLLEYGLCKLAVITTNVGECPKVIKNDYNGQLVNSEDAEVFSEKLNLYIENKEIREEQAGLFNKHIKSNYSESEQMKTILKVYKEICN